MSYDSSRFWKAAFVEHPYGAPADDLAAAFRGARKNAVLLAGEIERELPSFTKHDASHVDALWDMADRVAGPGIDLNPLEAYVFGGALLIHDLGMGVAAYPGGVEGVKSSKQWPDALALAVMARLGRFPTEAELADASDDEVHRAIETVLRQRHAFRAVELGAASWDEGETRHFLFPEPSLRDAFGELIGDIAASHWWSVEEVSRVLDRVANPPAGYPPEWAIDVLKLACLLRAADAIHIDGSRAPRFLQVVRGISGYSKLHWDAQARIAQAVVDRDHVRFTSEQSFGVNDAEAWWTAFDLIANADRELRAVDALLFDLGRERFQAVRVAGAEDPQRLATLVRTRGWSPVRATLSVADVSGVIERFGGAALYGDDPLVPLRELVQNACDAVRARRVLEARDGTWGSVRVDVTRADGDQPGSVTVRDSGVGMSVGTLTTTFLEFGTSLWRSPRLVNVHPGLAGSGFEATGQFGIGFFSVFMWGDRVLVKTRRPRDVDTIALDLTEGAQSRPIVREADDDRRLPDGGTSVRVEFRSGSGPEPLRGPDAEIVDAILSVAPALPVRLEIATDSGEVVVASKANDWLTMPADELLRRVGYRPRVNRRGRIDDYYIADLARRVRPILDDGGRVVGRACVATGYGATLVVGGFAAGEVPHMAGIVVGGQVTLARDKAVPMFSPKALAQWLDDQIAIVAADPPESWHVRLAETAWRYGLSHRGLPICLDSAGRPIRRQDVEAAASSQKEIWVVHEQPFAEWLQERGFDPERYDEIELNADFLDVETAPLGLPMPAAERRSGSASRLIVAALEAAWGAGNVSTTDEEVEIGNFEGEPVHIEATVHRRTAP